MRLSFCVIAAARFRIKRLLQCGRPKGMAHNKSKQERKLKTGFCGVQLTDAAVFFFFLHIFFVFPIAFVFFDFLPLVVSPLSLEGSDNLASVPTSSLLISPYSPLIPPSDLVLTLRQPVHPSTSPFGLSLSLSLYYGLCLPLEYYCVRPLYFFIPYSYTGIRRPQLRGYIMSNSRLIIPNRGSSFSTRIQ